MSHEYAQAFIQQVNQHEELQRKVVALNGDLNGLLAMAAESGFHFSAEDWRAVMQSLQSGELTLNDLEYVVGGLNTFVIPAPGGPLPIPYPNWPK